MEENFDERKSEVVIERKEQKFNESEEIKKAMKNKAKADKNKNLRKAFSNRKTDSINDLKRLSMNFLFDMET